jgi:hypothetical protein
MILGDECHARNGRDAGIAVTMEGWKDPYRQIITAAGSNAGHPGTEAFE